MQERAGEGEGVEDFRTVAQLLDFQGAEGDAGAGGVGGTEGLFKVAM